MSVDLPEPGNARDTGEQADGQIKRNVFKIVTTRADNAQMALASGLRYFVEFQYCVYGKIIAVRDCGLVHTSAACLVQQRCHRVHQRRVHVNNIIGG